MKKISLCLGILATLGAIGASFYVLTHESALVTHPKGIIAREELHHINTHILLMLIVVVPAMILLGFTAWKFSAKNSKAKHLPEKTSGVWAQILIWIIPSSIIAAMIVTTWTATHKLDPYKPLESDVAPLNIQVVALNWKWLFIYPEQAIATINFVQFPERTPIKFSLAADGSPMNSFWIPELSGQIYSMTGMVTPLHIMADGPGIYPGRAAEINGEGYAGMTFTAKSSTQGDFDSWVEEVKKSPQHLSESVYNELVKPSENHPVTLYSHVEKELFNKIVMKYMGHSM